MSVRTLVFSLYLLFAIGLTGSVTKNALDSVHMPFVGILPFENLFVGAFTQLHWDGAEKNLRSDHRIEKLNGQRLASGNVWHSEIANAHFRGEESVQVEIQGLSDPMELKISRLPSEDVFKIFAPLLFTGVAFLLIGLVSFLLKPTPSGAPAFTSYCAVMGGYFLTAFDFHTSYQWSKALLIFFAFVPATVLYLSFTFPKSLDVVKKKRWINFLPFLLSFVLLAPYLFLFELNPNLWRWVEKVFVLYLSLSYLFWVGLIFYRSRSDVDKTVRKQCQIILYPLVIAFGVVFVAAWLTYVFGMPLPMNWIGPICILFPAFIAYGMFRGNLFLVDHLETQVQERTKALQAAQAELFESSKLAAVGLLSAGTAHEIGNAMNLIFSNLPVLKKYSDRLLALAAQSNGEKEEDKFMRTDLPVLLQNLNSGASRALQIAEDLKHFSKPPSDIKEPNKLSAIVEATLRLMKSDLGTKISIEKDFGSDPTVHMVSGQIQQVVLNLLMNAKQAIDGEGVIKIRIQAENDFVFLQVEDSGKGMDEENQKRLFEPFYTTKEHGTGLGLSVSFGIVKSHGGRLKVQSELGKGTTMTMVLPKTRGE